MNKHLSSIKKTAVLVAVSWLAMPAFAGIGGFIDAQVGSRLSGTPEESLNSEIADAAVYLSKELGRGKVMVDLPFSFTAANAALPAPFGTSYDSAFRAFNTKAQAYINWSYDFGLSWQLGRFDSPFLNEANDTVGLGAFATQGHLFSLLPRMHNGLMLTYGTGPVTLMGIASRQDGTVGAREAGENLEYGVMGKWTHDAMYVGAGLYMHNPGTAGTANTNSHQIIEVMAGTKMSDWTIDAQALFTKTAIASAESGIGLGATINYAVDKTWSVGIRPNYSSKVAGAATAHTGVNTTGSTLEVAVGPQVNLTDDLRMRANYTYTSVKATSSATAANTSDWTLSAVYKF
jgi:hypothetical protein